MCSRHRSTGFGINRLSPLCPTPQPDTRMDAADDKWCQCQPGPPAQATCVPSVADAGVVAQTDDRSTSLIHVPLRLGVYVQGPRPACVRNTTAEPVCAPQIIREVLSGEAASRFAGVLDSRCLCLPRSCCVLPAAVVVSHQGPASPRRRPSGTFNRPTARTPPERLQDALTDAPTAGCSLIRADPAVALPCSHRDRSNTRLTTAF